jgi:hypothetical protein
MDKLSVRQALQDDGILILMVTPDEDPAHQRRALPERASVEEYDHRSGKEELVAETFPASNKGSFKQIVDLG